MSQRIGPGEARRPVLGRRTGLGDRSAGPVAHRVDWKVSDVAQQRGQERARSLRAGVMREATTPQRHAEEGLGGHGSVRGVPARVGAQENGQQPRGVTAVEHRAERLEDLPAHLRQVRPVDLDQTIPGCALERLQRGGSRPRGGPGGHGKRMPDPRAEDANDRPGMR